MSAPVGIVLQASVNRYGRERIDVPLALASLDVPLQVFVLDDAAWDLCPGQGGENTWTRLWSALAEMDTPICIAGDSPLASSASLPVNATVMSHAQMAQAMSGCRHLLHV